MTSQQRRRGVNVDDEIASPIDPGTAAIYAAAHEMRTPLTAILGFAEVLRADAPILSQDDLDRMLGHIVTNARAQLQIIERWLGGVDVKSGARPPIFDLRADVVGLCQDLGPIIKGHTFDVSIDEGDMSIAGESDAFREVLTNLLMNAVKYSDAGSAIRVTADRTSELVTVAVRSVGNVVAPQALRHLFDEGYRVSRDAGPRGFGLGLSIARSLATQLGGRIWAERDGKQMTFKLTLRTAAA